jgi:hypothetical protein
MKVYNYTEKKIYYSVTDAQPSPAEPNKFLIPRNATSIKPPDFDANTHQAYWSGSEWVIQVIPEPEPDPYAKPPEIITWERIKMERNSYLRESDWTDLPNAPLSSSVKQNWLNYRQALRDVPQNFSTPESVVWPTKPS